MSLRKDKNKQYKAKLKYVKSAIANELKNDTDFSRDVKRFMRDNDVDFYTYCVILLARTFNRDKKSSWLINTLCYTLFW